MSGRFDPERVFEVLQRHDVEYVLIGGLAAVAHGSPLPTTDVDVTPDRRRENLDRLAGALRELEARIRTTDPDGVVFPVDGAFLAAQPRMLNLTTAAGDVDLTFVPAGFEGGFDDLCVESDPVELVDGVIVRVATLRAIIRSKEAADREKDRRALPYLRALLDETGG
ncbi:MAG: hypothetical protein K1X38_04130 [Microthrixaceae bacterium]|nr:hypothetical protein [Microthrixaceae bacterium]